MAPVLHKICYINDSKRYGIFAAQQIPEGTEIFQEFGVILDVGELKGIITSWNDNHQSEKSLHKDEKVKLESQTQKILNGMSDLQKRVKKNERYEEAMKIHNERMKEDNIYGTDTKDSTTTIHPYPKLSMDLYKQAINTSRSDSDNVLSVILHNPLQRINTFLHGVVEVRFPDCQAWGSLISLVNHGCHPNSMVSCIREPDPETKTMRRVGIMAIRALTTIEAGEEITIEYTPALGTLEERRSILRQVGIANCSCSTCESEENLASQSNHDDVAKQNLEEYTDLNIQLLDFFTVIQHQIQDETPAYFFQALYRAFHCCTQIKYWGPVYAKLWHMTIDYAKLYNDNVRVYWLAKQLYDYYCTAYGRSHIIIKYFEEQIGNPCLKNAVDNPERMDTFTFVKPYEVTNEQSQLIFMTSVDVSSPDYHLLAINSSGELEPVTRAENEARVRLALAASTLVEEEDEEEGKGEEEQEDAAAAAAVAAVAAADAAAATLLSAEAAEAAKKTKTKEKRKEKEKKRKERKRAAAAAVVAAVEKEEEEKEKRLAARKAAVLAATVVPALPLPRPRPRAASPPPPPPVSAPARRSFRSSSCSDLETAFLVRFPAAEYARGSGFEHVDVERTVSVNGWRRGEVWFVEKEEWE